MTKKNILITGGAGFLGTHLCNKLLSDGNYIICVDNFYSSSRNNIKKFEKNPNFIFIEQDICNLDINLKIDQIPVKWTDDPNTSVNIINTAIEDILGLIKLRLKLFKKTKHNL